MKKKTIGFNNFLSYFNQDTNYFGSENTINKTFEKFK